MKSDLCADKQMQKSGRFEVGHKVAIDFYPILIKENENYCFKTIFWLLFFSNPNFAQIGLPKN